MDTVHKQVSLVDQEEVEWKRTMLHKKELYKLFSLPIIIIIIIIMPFFCSGLPWP
jgi:hypothetical protein